MGGWVGDGGRENEIILSLKVITISAKLLFEEISIRMLLLSTQNILNGLYTTDLTQCKKM